MNPMTSAARSVARLVSALLVACAAMGADTLTLTAPATALALNGTVQVTVGVTGASAFSTWGECLTWDKTKLQLVSQDTFTSAYGTAVNDSRSVTDINTSGEVRTGGYYVTGTTYPNNAGGTAATAKLTFKRIAAGSTALTAQIKNGSYPFGAVLINVAGTERVPAATAALTFTDGGAMPGDLTGDSHVRFDDLSAFLAAYGKSSGQAGYRADADMNGAGTSAGKVDFADLSFFLAVYER